MTKKLNPFDMSVEDVFDDFSAYYLTDTHTENVSLHHHDFFEIYFLMKGNLDYIIENLNYSLIPGDILLISPSELHQPIFYSKSDVYQRAVIHLKHSYLVSLGSNKEFLQCFSIGLKRKNNLIRLDPKESMPLFDKAILIANEWAGKDVYSKRMAEALVVELLVSINRIASTHKPVYQITDPAEKTLADILDYINRNLSAPLTLDDLAREFYTSKFNLIRIFKKHMDITVHRYITQRRLMYGKELLYKGYLPTEIPQKCGYSDYSSFYTAFKAQYNLTPKEFYQLYSQKKVKPEKTDK